MKLPSLPSIRVADSEVNKALTDLVTSLKPLFDSDFTIGRRVTIKFESAEEKTVNHGLGRQPSGFLVLDVQAPDPVSFCRTGWDRESITLKSSGPATLTIWVF